MDQVDKFPSLTVDINSPTPYTDATQVGRGRRKRKNMQINLRGILDNLTQSTCGHR